MTFTEVVNVRGAWLVGGSTIATSRVSAWAKSCAGELV